MLQRKDHAERRKNKIKEVTLAWWRMKTAGIEQSLNKFSSFQIILVSDEESV